MQVSWDYDRFSESDKKRRNEKFFEKISLGPTSRPCIIIDTQGKILMWYLPALLLPTRVVRMTVRFDPPADLSQEQLNTFVMGLRSHLLHALQANRSKSWRQEGFVGQPEELGLGAGQLSIAVGRFAIGHKVSAKMDLYSHQVNWLSNQRLIDPIKPSASLHSAEVQKWLSQMQPMEQFLDAVLRVVHPELWTANIAAAEKLVQQLPSSAPSWPTSFTGMDLIVNRVTPPHLDGGGAVTFYDHLLSLGFSHQATLALEDLEAEFAYGPGTSVFLTGKVLTHSVPAWSGGERVVIAHYSKDDVHDRLGIPQPTLPTQLGLLALFTAST